MQTKTVPVCERISHAEFYVRVKSTEDSIANAAQKNNRKEFVPIRIPLKACAIGPFPE